LRFAQAGPGDRPLGARALLPGARPGACARARAAPCGQPASHPRHGGHRPARSLSMYRLDIRPTSRFSSDVWIQEGNRNLTLLDLARLRSRAEFLLAGNSWEVQSSGLLRREYRLERDGRVEASATRVQL